MTPTEFIDKNGVTFRFKSWALIPSKDCWSNWTFCTRQTMVEFLRVLNRIDEQSNAHLSPKYAEQYSACEEVQCIVNSTDECWTWRRGEGWYPTPEDPTLADIPTGKGKRPPRKSKEQREAERKAAEAEIYGEPKTLDDTITMDDIEDPLADR